MPKVEINKKAPEFSLAGIDGKEVNLSDFYNRSNVLVVFNRGFT